MVKSGMRRVRYRSGDVFQLPFPDGSFGYGRILLDVFRLRRAGAFDSHCALSGMCGSGLLVQLYRMAFSQPISSISELDQTPRFLDELMDHRQIYRAEFPIVGNLPVQSTDIDFPEYVCADRPNPGEWHYTFQKGAIVVKLPISYQECESLPKPSFSLDLSLERVFEAIQDWSGREAHAPRDLRVDARRVSILAMAGLDLSMTYDDMCAKVGGQTAEELLSKI